MQKILREPLFHFLVIGAGLFALYSFLNPSAEQVENNIIRIEDSDVQRLIKAYQQNWSTPPDSATLKSLLKEEIKAEVFYREALRMQLDHNDEIIRRRLKQKYEFLVKDLADSQRPSDATLQAFYEENRELYKEPTKYSFSQIYFSPDKRKKPLTDAQSVFNQLETKKGGALNLKKLGDSFHLQQYFADRDYNDVRQLFGQDFAKALFATTNTGWVKPIHSGYGIHLVNITTIQEASVQPFNQVSNRVGADWKVRQQQLYNEQLYQNLLEQYEVEYDLEKWGEL